MFMEPLRIENGACDVQGFNSWNDPILAMDITEVDLMRQADFMNSSGMKALGYRYVNTDSGWQGGRFPNGTQYSHPVAFPHGIAWLADYIHARGLLFGLYGSADTRDCAGPRYETKESPEPYEGSMYLEAQDAAHWAAAGVDSLHVRCHQGIVVSHALSCRLSQRLLDLPCAGWPV